jgi:deoxyribose-phosphate aldolase
MNPRELAGLIDHTLLSTGAGADDIDRLCSEAVKHGMGAVCVAPCWVAQAARRTLDSTVKVVTVAGFPHGTTLSDAKAREAELALSAGADEIDMVINIGWLMSGLDQPVEADIQAVAEVVHATGRAIVKVILETALLTTDEKRRACTLSLSAGADFVKTSTGFNGQGATVADVRLLRECVGDRAGVKASGGIRTYAQAVAMLDAGATRLGCSASTALLRELHELRQRNDG